MLLRSFLLTVTCCAWGFSSAASDMVLDWMTNGTILVCKANQCVQTNHNMSREYLTNQISALTQANSGQYLDVCEADSTTHQCVRKGISFPVQSPVIQTNVSISKARLIESRAVKDVPGLDLLIDYKVRAGDTFPRCQTALSRIGIVHAGSSEMMSPQFNCKLTETGNTTFSLAYHVDYIDFDQGVIGAAYTAAADNVLSGAGAGYILLDFAKGVQMEPTETFPYPEQLAALQSGEVATFDTPADIEAVWMKPTPFLNLLTPTFAPNECNTFEGGCSAQMLNNPQMAVPPAKEKIDSLTPKGVASTTGLIQQKVTYENVSPAEKTTVYTKQIILENGKTVYTEDQTRHFVRETMDSESVEDTTKAKIITSGEKPVPMDKIVQNAEKEYAAMKKFENQTVDTDMTEKKRIPTASTNVEIVLPEGTVLTDAERAYIEQLALPPEVLQAQQQGITETVVPSAQNNAPQQVVRAINTPSGMPAQKPAVAQVPAQQMPIDAGMPVVNVGTSLLLPVENQPIVITPDEQPVKEKQKSFWGNVKEKVDTFFYF